MSQPNVTTTELAKNNRISLVESKEDITLIKVDDVEYIIVSSGIPSGGVAIIKHEKSKGIEND